MLGVLGLVARLGEELHVDLGRLVVVHAAGRVLRKGDVDLAVGVHTHLRVGDSLAVHGDVTGQTLKVVLGVGDGDTGVVLVAVGDDRLGLRGRRGNGQAVVRLNRPRSDFDARPGFHTGAGRAHGARLVDLPRPRLFIQGIVQAKPHRNILHPARCKREFLGVGRNNVRDVERDGIAAFRELGVERERARLLLFHRERLRDVLGCVVDYVELRLGALEDALTLLVQGDPRQIFSVSPVQRDTSGDTALVRLPGFVRTRGGNGVLHDNLAFILSRVADRTRRADKCLRQRVRLRRHDGGGAESHRDGARGDLLRVHWVLLDN